MESIDIKPHWLDKLFFFLVLWLDLPLLLAVAAEPDVAYFSDAVGATEG